MLRKLLLIGLVCFLYFGILAQYKTENGYDWPAIRKMLEEKADIMLQNNSQLYAEMAAKAQANNTTIRQEAIQFLVQYLKNKGVLPSEFQY